MVKRGIKQVSREVANIARALSLVIAEAAFCSNGKMLAIPSLPMILLIRLSHLFSFWLNSVLPPNTCNLRFRRKRWGEENSSHFFSIRNCHSFSNEVENCSRGVVMNIIHHIGSVAQQHRGWLRWFERLLKGLLPNDVSKTLERMAN